VQRAAEGYNRIGEIVKKSMITVASILESAAESHNLIGVRLENHAWDEYLVGTVLSADYQSIKLQEIDENGLNKKIIDIVINDIKGIDFMDRYLIRLEFLMKSKKSTKTKRGIKISNTNDVILANQLSNLIEKRIIITLFLSNESFVVGIPLSFDSRFIIIKNIGTEGDEDGISCHLKNGITHIRYNSDFENRIRSLYDNSSLFYQ